MTGRWDDYGEPELADELRDLVVAAAEGEPFNLARAEALVAEADRRARVGDFGQRSLLLDAEEALEQLRGAVE